MNIEFFLHVHVIYHKNDGTLEFEYKFYELVLAIIRCKEQPESQWWRVFIRISTSALIQRRDLSEIKLVCRISYMTRGLVWFLYFWVSLSHSPSIWSSVFPRLPLLIIWFSFSSFFRPFFLDAPSFLIFFQLSCGFFVARKMRVSALFKWIFL